MRADKELSLVSARYCDAAETKRVTLTKLVEEVADILALPRVGSPISAAANPREKSHE